MMKALSLALLAFAFVGCSSSGGSAESTAAVPKSAADLPATMPETDRAKATSALGAAQAQQAIANDPARVRAMEEMKKQHGGG